MIEILVLIASHFYVPNGLFFSLFDCSLYFLQIETLLETYICQCWWNINSLKKQS